MKEQGNSVFLLKAKQKGNSVFLSKVTNKDDNVFLLKVKPQYKFVAIIKRRPVLPLSENVAFNKTTIKTFALLNFDLSYKSSKSPKPHNRKTRPNAKTVHEPKQSKP